MKKILRLLFITLVFWGIENQTAFSSSSDEEEKRDEKQERHLSSYKPASSFSPSIASGLEKLELDELPIAGSGQLYVQEKSGPVLKRSSAASSSKKSDEMFPYGPNESGKVNYLSSGNARRQESFAHTRPDVYKGSRKYPLPTYKGGC